MLKTVAFTGYRREKINFSENSEEYFRFRALQLRVIKRLIEKGYTTFISGMAIGFDTWVAEDICRLKKEKGISLVCAVPFPKQDSSWSMEDKQRRKFILNQADEVKIITPYYSKECFFIRNRYMVDNASVVVCCYDGKGGGTAYTVNYALEKNKTIIQINPTTFKVSIINQVEGF